MLPLLYCSEMKAVTALSAGEIPKKFIIGKDAETEWILNY